MSRRRNNRPQSPSPSLTSATEEFSDQELDFFKRGDELNAPTPEPSDSPDADA